MADLFKDPPVAHQALRRRALSAIWRIASCACPRHQPCGPLPDRGFEPNKGGPHRAIRPKNPAFPVYASRRPGASAKTFAAAPPTDQAARANPGGACSLGQDTTRWRGRDAQPPGLSTLFPHARPRAGAGSGRAAEKGFRIGHTNRTAAKVLIPPRTTSDKGAASTFLCCQALKRKLAAPQLSSAGRSNSRSTGRSSPPAPWSRRSPRAADRCPWPPRAWHA